MRKIHFYHWLLMGSLAFLSFSLLLFSEKEPQQVVMEEVLPLKLRYGVGETLHYRLVRQNNNFGLDGTKQGEMKVVTYFTRTRLENDSQGRISEKFTWKRFCWGQTMSPSPVKMVEFKEAKDFSLIYSVNDEEGLSKFDFSSLPRTIHGFFFMILTWDAITFDGPVRPNKYFPVPELARIGTEFKDTRESYELTFEYLPLVTQSKYVFSGKDRSKLIGVSIVKNIPCAVIEFENVENTVEMNIQLKPMEIKTHGFEHFWGKTYLSLEDGRVIRGELVGPIVLKQDIKRYGQEKPDHSDLFAVGYLEMDLLTEEEFEKELKDCDKMDSFHFISE